MYKHINIKIQSQFIFRSLCFPLLPQAYSFGSHTKCRERDSNSYIPSLFHFLCEPVQELEHLEDILLIIKNIIGI